MKRAAIFDFNGTLLPYDFGLLFLKFHKKYFKNSFLILKIYTKIVLRIISYKSFKRYTKEQFHADAITVLTRALKGYDKDKIDGFFSYLGKELAKLLDEDVLKELKQAKNEGYYTVVLSGTYTDLLECLIEHIDIDLAIGSELSYMEIDNKQYLDFTKELDIVKNETKALRIKEALKEVDFNKSIAYADSYFDKPILDLVGEPICVNPDEQLLEIANEHNYKILYTRHKDVKTK